MTTQSTEERLTALENEVRALRGPSIQKVDSAYSPEGEQLEGPHVEFVDETIPLAGGAFPGLDATDWINGVGARPGIVVDAGIARSTSCLRIDLGAERKPLVFSKGILGALDEEEQTLYCTEGYEERQPTPQQLERLTTLSQASKQCAAEASGETTGEHLDNYMTCLSQELKVRGLEA